VTARLSPSVERLASAAQAGAGLSAGRPSRGSGPGSTPRMSRILETSATKRTTSASRAGSNSVVERLPLSWMIRRARSGSKVPVPLPQYLVQTYWENEQAFWDWTNSESFRTAHSNRPPAEMFAGPNVLEIHEVIQSTERRGAPTAA